MRTSKALRGLSLLCVLLCAAASFGQTGAPIPLISQVAPSSITPSTNPNLIVQFTVTILGANFPQNPVVKLTIPQGPSLYAASASVNATGSQIVAQFNTTLPRPAVYTVTVANAVNNPTAVSNGFYLPITPPATTVGISQDSSGFLTGSPIAMATGDFNGDGNVDVAVVSQNTNTISILLGTFGPFLNPGAGYPTGNTPSGIVAADFNGDGVLDLAYSNAADNTITILLGNGDGTFRPGTTINDTGAYPTQLVAADLNGDGRMDLAVLNVCGPVAFTCSPQAGGSNPGAVLVLLGNGDGTFSASPSSPATGAMPWAIAAADLNGDGAIDLVVTNELDHNVTVLMGNGDGTFIPTQSSVVTGFGSSGLVIADFNGDGKLDLAVANLMNNTVSIFLNQNCGLPAVNCTFSPALMSFPVGNGPYAMSAGDMNADGFVDLVTANLNDSSITVLLGDGAGGFTAVLPQQPANFSTGPRPVALALADFSGDGRLDVATVNNGGSYSILTQTAVPQVILTTSNNSPTYGMPLSFTAQVNPSFGAQPTGTVTLFDGRNSLETAALSGYQANFFSFPLLLVGTHQITATYNGDANFLPSISAAVTETVSQAPTSLTLTSNINGLPFGQAFTLTATVVIPNLGSPSGTASFFDISNSTSLGTAQVTNGVAQLTLSTLSPGAHVITATYSGDSNFFGSSSPTYQENITQASTTTSVTTSASPVNLGQTPTFTASVQPSASTAATGFVAFFADGSTPLGAAQITNNSAQLRSPVLAVGPHAITAQYTGDTNYTSSTSSSILEMVNPAADTVNLTTNPSVYGQSVNFVASVQGVNYSGIATGTMTFSDGSTVLGIAPLSNGSAQFTATGLVVGTHQISASYSGDSNFQPATSAQVAANVFRANTTTVVTSAQNPSAFGQAVTLTAAVQPAFGGTATGTVTFLDGSATLGTAPLNGNLALLSVSGFSVGAHSISAAYVGDSNVNASASAPVTQTVNPSPTSVTLTSNLNPSTYGQNLTLAATVKAAFGTAPASTVSFYDGTTLLGTVNTATAPPQITILTLTGGTHSITAQYAGNANFASSTSAVLTQTVNAASTTTTVFANVNPSSFGQAVTLTGAVDSTYHFASSGGTVTFYDNGVSIGSGVIEGNAVTLTTSTLATGTHSITASYGGDSNLTPSTSAAYTEMVNQAAVSPTIALSSYAIAYGQSITMTSNVKPAFGGTPTGTVTFWLTSTTALGTGTLVNGTAQATTTAVPVGSRSIYATYNGDTNFASSSSLPTQLTVSQATTTTVATADVNPANYGQTVTFSATVQSSGGTPTGTVTFLDGTTALGTTALASGAAQLPVSNFGAGTHSITAKYSGDTNFSTSTSSPLTETVNQLATTTTVASSANPATAGQAVTLTATVQAGSGISVTGTVTFLDGSTTLGTGTLASNAAQLTTSALTPGTHTLTAVYATNGNFTGSTSAALAETVNQVTTTTSLASGLNPAPAGQSVTFTASIQAGAGNSATGTITFLDGSATLGTVTVSNNSAQFTTSNLAPGTHSITAVYGGSTNFAGSSSSALVETVNLITTSTTVASSANPALAGQAITFTATLQAGTGNSATGTVNFLDGSTSLGTATVANNSAQISVSTLAVGAHTITAVYSGSTDFAGSTSSALAETVNQSGTTTTVVSNLNPATFGQAIPFVATVQTASGGAATGTVTFYDGSTILATATVENNGVQHNVAMLTFGGLPGGTHIITASYSGDANYTASTSSALTETINPATSSLTLGASSNPASYGQAVTLTATVVPSLSGDLASGTVTFFDGSNSLGTASVSNNIAQLSATSFAAGSHSITASYGGDRNFGSSSAALTETVNPAATSTVVTSTANPVRVGISVTFNATVSSAIAGTQSGTVSFYVDGSSTPSATVALSSGLAQFSTSSLSAGTHTVVAAFASTNANFAGSTSATFMQSIADFTLSVSPSSLTVARSSSGTYTLTVTSVGGFSGTVSLSCGGAPANAPCVISPTQVTVSASGSAQATATITANKHAATATHTLTFTSTSGSLTHQQTATLVID